MANLANQKKQINKELKKYDDALEATHRRFVKLKFKVGDIKIDCDLDKELKINSDVPAVIAQQMSQAPARSMYWSLLLEDLLDHERLEIHRYDLWLNPKFTNYAAMDDYKKASQAFIERLVAADCVLEYKKWKTKLITLKKIIGKVKIVVKSYEMKVDMLRSIGAILRQEMANQGMST